MKFEHIAQAIERYPIVKRLSETITDLLFGSGKLGQRSKKVLNFAIKNLYEPRNLVVNVLRLNN